MKQYAVRTVAAVVCILVLWACSPPPPPPPPPAPVGPQSKEEVAVLIKPIIDPLRTSALPGGPVLPDSTRQMVVGQLRDTTAQYGGTEFGRAALRDLGYEISELAKSAAMDERWRLTMTCIDAFEVLSMESKLLNRLGERAEKMLEQPTVRVRGFLEDGEKGDLYVFMELIDRKTGDIKRVEAREGEEFEGLRLLKVVGRNQKVRMEYLKIPGLIFDVPFEPNN